MGGDSSSGEDEEVDLSKGTTAAAAVAAAVPSPAPAPPPPVAAPAPAPPPPPAQQQPRQQAAAPVHAPGKGGSQMDRLKSLYASQPKRQTTPQPAPVPATVPAPAPVIRPPQAAPQQGVPAPLRPNTNKVPTPQPIPQQRPPQQQAMAQQQQQQQMPQQQYQQRQQQQQQQMPQQTGHRPQQQQQQQQQRQQPVQQRQQHVQQQRQQQQSQQYAQQRSRPQPAATEDPFAPTPLNHMKERHQQRQQVMPQHQQVQQQQQQPIARPTQPVARPTQPQQRHPSQQQQAVSTGGSSSSQQRSQMSRADMEREVRRQKEKFLMFTRVLIKYLEQKDPAMHAKAKHIIKDCAERNKRQEPGYESVTASMKTRLKQLVGDNYWKRAEVYLKHFLEQKKQSMQKQGQGGSSSSASQQKGTPGQSSTSASAQQQAQAQKVAQEKARRQQLAAQRAAAQAKAQQQAAAAAKTQQAAPSIESIKADIENKKKALAGGTPQSKSGKTASKKSSSRRKSSTSTPKSKSSSTAAATAAAAAAAAASSAPAPAASSGTPQDKQPPEPEEIPPREYTEFMEMLDHAIDYDWESAGLLLGSKTDIQLSEEQRKLLYGTETPAQPKPKPEPKENEEADSLLKGWGKRNLLSERAAWARVRLREHRAQRSNQVVGGGTLTLPGGAASPPPAAAAWVNEEKAEQDQTLTMLSEGCEAYIRDVLEKAIQCARQRQNLDGIRLWHQQHSTSTNTEKPPLAVRLGCDVSRQVAQAAGNAAMTCKRMEQALERQSDVPSRARVLEGETLVEATSMADLAMRPMLAKGVENADYHGKRSFEMSGGKEASEPPLGRVPKKAKLEVVDFIMGSTIADGVGRHKAGPASSSFCF